MVTEQEGWYIRILARRCPFQIGLMLFFILVVPRPLQGAPLSDAQEWMLYTEIEILEDPGGKLALGDVRNHGSWQANGTSVFSKGFSNSAWWLRFTVTNENNRAVQRLLSLSFPQLDNVLVHVLPDSGTPLRYQLGRHFPYQQRPIDHPFYVLPLEWAPGETTTVYLRILSTSAVQAPLTLWQPEAFYSHDMTRNIMHGIYFGALLAISIYNLLLFFALGERNYLYYVAFVICLVLFMVAFTGYGFRYLWPTATGWNDQAILVFLSGALGFGALFSRRFLCLRDISPGLDNGVKVVVVLSVICVVLSFVTSYRFMIGLLALITVLASVYGLYVGIYAWYRGQVTARFYVIAWSFPLLGGIVLVLNKVGILPPNSLTNYSAQIGNLFEVVLLSFALAQRINVERRLRFKAQSETLAISHKLNLELEERVRERTRELESLNKELNELSVTDGLTGLKNRRYLDRLLEQELARAKRSGRPLAVVLLDIDHFKPINDRHGHHVGDECIKVMAGMIQDGLNRPADIAFRYGGEEFVLMLPDTDMQGALGVADRIRERILAARIEVAGLTLSMTVSAGVCAPKPHAELTPQDLLKGADTALYEAKEQGRNRTRLYHLVATA